MKRSLSNFFKFFKNHSFNLRICNLYFGNSSSLKNIMAVNIGFWKACNFVYNTVTVVDFIQTSRDREWSHWALFAYFTFSFSWFAISSQRIGLALPNERRRRQRLESTEIEHRPIVSTYKLQRNVKSHLQILEKQLLVETGFSWCDCDEDWQHCVKWSKPDGHSLIINPYLAYFYFQFQLICYLRSEFLNNRRNKTRNFKYF